jgi:hypothetical protein
MLTKLDEIAYDTFKKDTQINISITFFKGFSQYALKKYYKKAEKTLRKEKLNNL